MSNQSCEPTCPVSIIFADAVLREMGTGKLTLIGTFHHFIATKFPFSSTPFVVIVEIHNLEGDLTDFPVSIRIEERSSAQVVASTTAKFSSKRPLQRSEVIQIPFSIPATQFPIQGNYDVVLMAGGEPIGKREIPIISTTATTQQTS